MSFYSQPNQRAPQPTQPPLQTHIKTATGFTFDTLVAQYKSTPSVLLLITRQVFFRRVRSVFNWIKLGNLKYYGTRDKRVAVPWLVVGMHQWWIPQAHKQFASRREQEVKRTCHLPCGACNANVLQFSRHTLSQGS